MCNISYGIQPCHDKRSTLFRSLDCSWHTTTLSCPASCNPCSHALECRPDTGTAIHLLYPGHSIPSFFLSCGTSFDAPAVAIRTFVLQAQFSCNKTWSDLSRYRGAAFVRPRIRESFLFESFPLPLIAPHACTFPPRYSVKPLIISANLPASTSIRLPIGLIPSS